jgi:hypothetical protein
MRVGRERNQGWAFLIGAQVVAFQHDLVNVAPAPFFAGLEGTHKGVVSGVEVLSGVLILGRVAAANVATRKTQAKMNPGVAHLEALLASFCFGVDGLDFFTVRTVSHGSCLF